MLDDVGTIHVVDVNRCEPMGNERLRQESAVAIAQMELL